MYWASVWYKVNYGNMMMGIVKPVAFSFIIAFISCYLGFTSEGGTKGVGKSTTNSVMMTSITILIVNFIITKIFGSMLKGYL
jgi:phospholipid/cholesterol/gamma-HCH transport system permease protein